MDIKKIKAAINKILNLKDCPYKLAKSLSLGFGLAFLPLPGINIFLSAVLAKLLKLNIFAATMPGVLLTSVAPFLYVLNYKTGALLMSAPEPPPEQVDIPYDLTFFSRVIDFFTHLGTAYIVGSIINALLVALLAYVVFLAFYKSTNRMMSEKGETPKGTSKELEDIDYCTNTNVVTKRKKKSKPKVESSG